MIGLDQDVLLRLWLDDDPAQNRPIDALLAEHGNEAGSLPRVFVLKRVATTIAVHNKGTTP